VDKTNVLDKARDIVIARASLPMAKSNAGYHMAKIDLDALSIEELVALRERVGEKITAKVAARQAELEAELTKLSQYGKPGKKAPAATASD
jgi:hypothetical protein